MFRRREAEARHWYEEAIRLDPWSPEARGAAGAFYLEQHDLRRALADLADAVNWAPGKPSFLVLRGDALVASGDVGNARLAYEAALKFDPKNAAAKKALKDLDAGKRPAGGP